MIQQAKKAAALKLAQEQAARKIEAERLDQLQKDQEKLLREAEFLKKIAEDARKANEEKARLALVELEKQKADAELFADKAEAQRVKEELEIELKRQAQLLADEKKLREAAAA